MKKYASPEVLLNAAAAKPMEPEAYKKAVFNLKKPHVDRKWKYDGKMYLPDDYASKKPFTDPTPRHWRKISIQASGDTFCLLAFGSRTRILPGDLRLAGVPQVFQLDDLPLQAALDNGAILDRIFCEKFPPKKA